jgi:mono/diheme cytochrome c family protein
MRSLSCIALTCVLAAPACGDNDDDQSGDIDAAPIADAAPSDAAEPDASVGDAERGQYLVEVVGACSDCHTPRNEDGTPDMTRFLAGNPSFVDILPEDDTMGNLPAPNLTSDATGLDSWSDDQIKDAFLNGVDDEGGALVPVMPYYVLHNMTDDDASAIVAYLRTVPAVEQEIPEKQEPFLALFTEPAEPFPVDAIPDTSLPTTDPDYEAAQAGRYLAGFLGVCMECHTERTDPNDPSSLDVTALFAGNEPFDIGPPFPDQVFSANITPDEDTGIGTWTPEDILTAIKEGTDDEDVGLCPPMPSGPLGPFGGFTDDDALAIGSYLLTIEPISKERDADCEPPPP